jgi:hypothetical protein
VIWRLGPEEEDPTRPEGSKVIPVYVLRIGPKTSSSGHTVYDDGPSDE